MKQPSERCGLRSPDAIPTVGAVLDLTPQQWRYDRQQRPVRVRVDRVLLDQSRTYGGAWVWIEGEVNFPTEIEPERQLLIRVDAIPDESRDTSYKPDPPGLRRKRETRTRNGIAHASAVRTCNSITDTFT